MGDPRYPSLHRIPSALLYAVYITFLFDKDGGSWLTFSFNNVILLLEIMVKYEINTTCSG